MSHFAKIDENNIVTQVIVAEQDFIDSGVVGDSVDWIKTSYTSSIRKNYAGIGYTYDLNRDAFIPPQNYPSWLLNEDICDWYPPVPYPLPEEKVEFSGSDDHVYVWDEDNITWKVIN